MGSLPKVDHMGEDSGLNRLSAMGEPLAGSAGIRPGEAPNELWEWLRLLNRRKALIVGAGLVAVALMALIIAQATPMYRGVLRIMLDTRTFKVVSTEAALSSVDTLNRRHPERSWKSSSQVLIGRVVDRLGWPPIRNSTAQAAGLPRHRPAARRATSGAPASPRFWRRRPPRCAARRARRAPGGPIAQIPPGGPPSARSPAISASPARPHLRDLVTVESVDGTCRRRIANAIAEVIWPTRSTTRTKPIAGPPNGSRRLAELRRNLQVAEEAVSTYRRDKGLAGRPEAWFRRRP